MRIYHECEGVIEKSGLRIADWHLEACRVMTNGDREGQIFLSHPLLLANHQIRFFIFIKRSQKLLNTLECDI